uniref:Secreted protein n=1 Tax=Pipistrellus kuhlii TaxID=59472 RepID=A0A7J7ZJ43_PIPKU|nr:hypothetical protein mPipKuh1_009510 [Pipistrellus kuhlii]
MFSNLFFLFIKFIGLTLVNKITWVSGAQLHSTSSVHCVVCSPLQVKSLSITTYCPITLIHLPFAPNNHHTIVLSMRVLSLLFLFFFESLHTPQPHFPIVASLLSMSRKVRHKVQFIFIFKITNLAETGLAQWIECQPAD